MDDETRTFLRGAYGYLEQHHGLLKQALIVSFALQKTVRELGPVAEMIYAKHYQAESQGTLSAELDASLRPLVLALRQLNQVN